MILKKVSSAFRPLCWSWLSITTSIKWIDQAKQDDYKILACALQRFLIDGMIIALVGWVVRPDTGDDHKPASTSRTKSIHSGVPWLRKPYIVSMHLEVIGIFDGGSVSLDR